ncbi:MAG: hypothetical protein HYX22_01930 [Candidatus Yanofskybacteria bacterium]|nr:hypothetical protein [Candidatus Yanofskybacteria bacterium]
MRKLLSFSPAPLEAGRLRPLVFVLVVAFAATGCATTGGGYVGSKPYPGPLGDVMAGNLGLTCPGDVFVGPPINRCLRHIGGGVGRYTNYPMYWGSSSGLRLSDADKVALLCGVGTGATATLSGASIQTVLASGVLGYVACRAIGMVAGRGNNRDRGGSGQEMVVVSPDQIPSPLQMAQAAPSHNGWDQRLRDTFSGGSGSSCLRAGLATLHNASGEILGVFPEGSSPRHKEKPLLVLLPGQRKCADPDLRYEAWVRQTAVAADGWVGGTQHTPRRPEAKPGMVLVWR